MKTRQTIETVNFRLFFKVIARMKHNRERLVSLGLLTLSYWHEYLDLVFFFKAVNGLVDVSHDVLPEVISETRTTRSSSGNQISFRPAKCKTTTYQRSFFVRASRTWNSLRPTLRSPGINIRQFKTDLQNYYLTSLRECFNHRNNRHLSIISMASTKKIRGHGRLYV